ncbi:MAG: transporter, partial [Bacteroidota bacterium]
FLDNKMNIGLDLNYFLNSNDVQQNSTNLQGRFRWSYAIGKGLNANLNAGLLRTVTDNIDPFSEFTTNLGIQYNFSYKKKKGEAPKQ